MALGTSAVVLNVVAPKLGLLSRNKYKIDLWSNILKRCEFKQTFFLTFFPFP